MKNLRILQREKHFKLQE